MVSRTPKSVPAEGTTADTAADTGTGSRLSHVVSIIIHIHMSEGTRSRLSYVVSIIIYIHMVGGTRSGGNGFRRERVAAFHIVSIIIHTFITTILWHGGNLFRREHAAAGTRSGGNGLRLPLYTYIITTYYIFIIIYG